MKTNHFRSHIESGLIPFLSVLVIVGIGEFLVMRLIIGNIESTVLRDLVDAVFLVILIAVPMYFIVLRPLQRSRRQAAVELSRKMAELSRLTNAIDSVMCATAPQLGENFFRSLVEELARALDVRHVLVSELLPGKPERVRSLAFWGNGRLFDNIEYQLAGTPCENVVGKSFCVYHRNVQQLFPEDKDLQTLNAESYLGVPLFSSRGEALGNLVALNDREMPEDKYTESLFKIVASRAAAEMERLREEQQLVKTREELERAERLKSLATMAGGVAHDLNNMLGPLVGYTEMLLEGLPSDSPYLSKMNMIHHSAEGIAVTVQDLLALARRGRYEMKETQLNDVVSRFVGSVTAEMILQKHKQVELVLCLCENLPTVSGSESHLSKIILNLISNACEAMPNGGLLTITTSARSINQLPSGFAKVKPGEYVVLQVRDSGEGIAAEDLQKIFDPFFSRKTMSSSGSGLGLAVVYGVIKDHGGYYDVASELGNGTEFSLYFPVLTASDADPRSEVKVAPELIPS